MYCIVLFFQMTLLIFEGIIVFSPQSSFLHQYSRLVKANVHGYIMVAALLCTLGGFSVIYYNKELNNKPHFQSWHGLVGVITVSYICLQVFGGVWIKKHNWTKKIINSRLADLKLYHATSGLLAFTLISISLLLAMWTDWFSGITTGTTWYACLACLSCMAMTVMIQITNEYLPQSKVVQSSPTSKRNTQNSKKSKKGK